MNGAFCGEERNGQESQSSLSSQASVAWGEARARRGAGEEGKQQFLRGFRGVLEAEGDLLAVSTSGWSLPLTPFQPFSTVGLGTMNHILHIPW